MKKRNMAITIAAVTAATSVAPALSFADTLNNKVIASNDEKAVAQLKGEIEKLLNTKYTENANLIAKGDKFNSATPGTCVYTIKYTLGSGTSAQKGTIANMDNLALALAKLNSTNKCLNITVVDNGHNTVNGQIVNWKEGKYTQKQVQALLNTQLSNEKNESEAKLAEAKAQAELATAQKTLADANEAVTKAQEGLTKAQEELKTANADLVAAHALPGENDEQKTERAKAVEAATAKVEKANDGVTKAQEELKIAKNSVTTASSELVKKQEAAEAASTKVSLIKTTAIEDVKKVDDNTVELTLKNNATPLVIKTGDVKLNLDAPIYSQDKMGSYLDKAGKIVPGVTSKEQAAKNDNTVVTGFEVQREALVRNNADQANSDFQDQVFGVDYKAVKTTNYKAAQLFDNSIGRLTPQGNQLKQFIEAYNAEGVVEGPTAKADDATMTIANGQLTIVFPVDKTAAMKNNAVATGTYAQIVVSGTKTELEGLKDALNGKAKIDVLAGTDRFNTAVQISKAKFEADNTADNVVLVSGYALADGLTATPFAAHKNAPVLLSDGKTISDDTMKEIQRVMAKGGTVYVIGGEDTVSKDVEIKLQAKEIKTARISGETRCETSLEIAEAMEAKLNGDVYIAGGYAEADAMSIAPIAARVLDVKDGVRNTTPIILADQNAGLTKDAVKYIATNKAAKTYIIGGADRAPEVIKTQLKDAKMTTNAKRLSGEDRQGTNAAVIKEFATSAQLANLYVAKSDNKGLVDSLAAGVLAGSKEAPILLATDSVNAEQQSVLKAKNPTIVTKTQAGEGIAAQVWATINSLFVK